jgi:hypothetical protein
MDAISRTEVPTYLTVRQFSDKYPAFPQGSLRHLIFHACARHTSKAEIIGNGLDAALVRIGRKVLINEPRFFEWVEKQAGR